VIHLQITRAQGNGFRDALGDDPGLDSRQPRQRNCGTVVRVEALGLDQAGAVQSEASLSLWTRALADFSSTLCGIPDCEPPGAGKIQILPSVSTPSTSKRMSLILRARALADDLAIAAILAGSSPSGQVA